MPGHMVDIGRKPEEILAGLEAMVPGLGLGLECARANVPWSKREIREYEAAALFALARQAAAGSASGGNILEIGTAYGYSCAVLAEAAPGASIVTLNPKAPEWEAAVENLSVYSNVRVVCERSWDYLAGYDGPALDLVFVDGDHGRTVLDFAWFERLRPGGLLLLHDYAPAGSGRPCQPVYEAANALRDGLGRDFDVHVEADDGVGLAGFYRREGETLPRLDVTGLLWSLVPGEGWVQ